MTVESTIDYEGLAQEAMRGVVRKVLARTAKSGLAGDHHFYISFDTEAPGVTLSKRLKEKYPREMTIVLQHRFWDLIVSEDRFEVKLTFDGIPERLVVPFASVKVFFDPSVRFGLQFDEPGAVAEPREPSTGLETMTPRGAITRTSHTRKSTRGSRKAHAADDAAAKVAPPGSEEGAVQAAEGAPVPTPFTSKPAAKRQSAQQEQPSPDAKEAAADQKPSGAEIVSLDKFRKK